MSLWVCFVQAGLVPIRLKPEVEALLENFGKGGSSVRGGPARAPPLAASLLDAGKLKETFGYNFSVELDVMAKSPVI